MPLEKISVSVGANSEIKNVLGDEGSAFQFLPYNAAIAVGMRQQTGNIADVLAAVQAGTDVLQSEGPIDVATGFPNPDNDTFLSDVASMGEQLLISLRNTTAGAITVTLILDITPL